jgi:hypothetical protein
VGSSDALVPPFEVSLPPPATGTGAATIPSVLRDVGDMVHCLSKGSRLPDRVTCRAWLDSVGRMAFASTAHPYKVGTDSEGVAQLAGIPMTSVPAGRVVAKAGKLHVPGASKMTITLDKRSIAGLDAMYVSRFDVRWLHPLA